MRKISAILAAIIMLFSVSVSAEKNLSVVDAKKLAIENSNLIKAADIKIEGDEIKAREELAKKNRTKNTSARPGYGASVVDTTLTRRGYYSDMYANVFTLSKLEKEKLLNTIEFKAVKAYYSLLNAQEKLKIKNESLELAKENAKAAAMKFDLGTVSRLELQSAEFAVQQLELELDIEKRGVEYARLELNNALGLDPSEAINPTDILEIAAPEEINIDEKIKTALDSRYEVIALKLNLSLAEKKAECFGAFYTKSTYFYKLEEYAVEKEKATLENTKNEIALSIKKLYNDYLDSYKQALTADIGVQNSELLYGLAKSKAENGLGTQLELTKAQNDLDSAKLKRAEAQTGYYLAKLIFESSLSEGIDLK